MEDFVGLSAGHGLAHETGEIQSGIGAEASFGLVDVHGKGPELAQERVHARHVIGMAMGQQEGDGGESTILYGLEEGLGFVATIHDPAVS